MAENYSKMFANPELTNKENIHQNSKYGKYSNFEEMKKTNCNHEQLLQYLSASNSQSLIKPACLKSWNSSVLLNKYANIGDYSQSQISQNKESNWQEDNQFVQKQQDTKFGTMSMLTNSSISGTHSIDLPLQASMNNNSSVASKAILALQEKIKSMEKENKLLREIVAKSSRDQNDTYQHHLEIEQIQSNHDDAIKTYQYREEDLLNKIQQLEESYSQMTAYTEACNIRIKEMEKVIEKRMDPKDFAKLNSDIRIDSSKYSELQQRNEEYEQIITGSNSRTKGQNQCEMLKRCNKQLEEFSDTFRKNQNSDKACIEDKAAKYKKESKRLKDQIVSLKKDCDAKINNLKRRHKLDVDGYKQECQIKDRDIERLKKEVERLTTHFTFYLGSICNGN